MKRVTHFLKYFDRSAPVRAIAMGTEPARSGSGAPVTMLWWVDPLLHLNEMVIAREETAPEFTLGDVPGITVHGATREDCRIEETGERGEFTPRTA